MAHANNVWPSTCLVLIRLLGVRARQTLEFFFNFGTTNIHGSVKSCPMKMIWISSARNLDMRLSYSFQSKTRVYKTLLLDHANNSFADWVLEGRHCDFFSSSFKIIYSLRSKIYDTIDLHGEVGLHLIYSPQLISSRK